MDIKRIDTNARMSQSVSHGGLVYLAGQVAQDTKQDVKGQTAQVLASVEARLREAGSDKDRILSATIHLTDADDFHDMNSIWEAWLPAGSAPARTTVIAQLVNPAFLVEVTVVAAT